MNRRKHKTSNSAGLLPGIQVNTPRATLPDLLRCNYPVKANLGTFWRNPLGDAAASPVLHNRQPIRPSATPSQGPFREPSAIARSERRLAAKPLTLGGSCPRYRSGNPNRSAGLFPWGGKQEFCKMPC